MSGYTAPPPPDDTGCCWASIIGDQCTCWEPVHDPPHQAAPAPGPARVRDRMCADCAYRPGSPEKTADPVAGHDGDDIETLAAAGLPFHCHDGMRAITGWQHPGGATAPAPTSSDGTTVHWDPPIIDGTPYRADGTPGLLCAGWAARHRALTAKEDT